MKRRGENLPGSSSCLGWAAGSFPADKSFVAGTLDMVLNQSNQMETMFTNDLGGVVGDPVLYRRVGGMCVRAKLVVSSRRDQTR